jgi:RimJ/RimL family protein N-acetyltransferase
MMSDMNIPAKRYDFAEHRLAVQGIRPPPRRDRHPHTPPRGPIERGETVSARDGTELILRAIRVDDVDALQRFFLRLTPEEVRMRFLHPLNELPREFARKLCDLDPKLAFAWVLASRGDPERPWLAGEIHGVARAHLDPVLDQAEFGLVVENRFAHQGLGTLLMRRAIDSARKLGAAELWSDVLLENTAMLGLCRKLGFERGISLNNPGAVRVSLIL